MKWFSILSIMLFLALILRSVLRLIKGNQGSKAAREYFLITVFVIHILVILFLLD